MFWRTYTSDQWELRRWGYVRHLGDFNELWGYTAYVCLRHRKTGKPKVVKIGNCCWTYPNMHAMNRAIFKKTGVEINGENAYLARRS